MRCFHRTKHLKKLVKDVSIKHVNIIPPREGLGLLLCEKLDGGAAAEEGGGGRGSELKWTGVRELGGC